MIYKSKKKPSLGNIGLWGEAAARVLGGAHSASIAQGNAVEGIIHKAILLARPEWGGRGKSKGYDDSFTFVQDGNGHIILLEIKDRVPTSGGKEDEDGMVYGRVRKARDELRKAHPSLYVDAWIVDLRDQLSCYDKDLYRTGQQLADFFGIDFKSLLPEYDQEQNVRDLITQLQATLPPPKEEEKDANRELRRVERERKETVGDSTPVQHHPQACDYRLRLGIV